MSRRLKFQLALLPIITWIQGVLQPLRQWQLPPKFLRRLVGGRVTDADFIQGSQKWMLKIIQDTHLQPDSRIFDIGCGCGAAALVFQKYLNQQGRYEAFDIFPELIYWCQRRIAAGDHRFHFRSADIYNQQYHSTGAIPPKDYLFEYPDNYFDLVFAWSVYTHLLEADLQHYIAESSRVLKPGGYLWVSYFLMRPEAQKAIKAKQSALDFSIKRTKYSWSVQTDIPETAVAYDENTLHRWYQKHHLKVIKTRYGHWIKQSEVIDFQDVLVAQKKIPNL